MKTKLLSIFIFSSVLMGSPLHASGTYGHNDNNAEKWRNCYRGARSPAPVINHNDIIIATHTGKKLQAEQVKGAIMQAAQEKDWSVAILPSGKLLVMRKVRRKHDVAVEITYDYDKYSIRYKDSTNMNYALCDNQAFIHPNYNVWVSNLNEGIQVKLRGL